MKKRIGNDITFTWHIYRKSGDTQTPESFDGKDVTIKLISPLQRPVTIEDVSIATGVVTFSFKGKHQVTLGNYVAILQENRGEDGMVTLDVVDAVTLVPHSYMEEDGDDGDVIEATSVELESTISAGSGGGIEQQQADWAQTDASAVDFIKHKPNLNEYVPKMDDDGHGNMSIYSPGNIALTLANEQGVVNQTGSFWAGGWSVSSPDGKFQTFGNSIYRGTMGFDHDSVVWENTATQQISAATTSAPGLMSAADKGKLNALPTATELTQELGGKQDTINDLATIRSGAQAGATAYQKPATGIPATDLASGVQSDLAAIDGIEAVIPEQASSSNQLADKDFVNSSIATATATYRGAYNLVTDLHLSVSATHAETATALATTVQTADNNDYCYVQIPTADDTPTEFASVERYKFNGTAWGYEYTLNNSGFTAAQWAALNSGITSGLVTKLSALPTNSELTTLLSGKANQNEMSVVPGTGTNADKTTITLKQDTSATVLTAHQDISGKADISSLASVATSGSYNDLLDKPTIQDLATEKAVYALDNTNPDYPSMRGAYTHLDITSGFGAISIVNINPEGTEVSLTDVTAWNYLDAEAIIDNTTYVSYLYNTTYFLGINIPFFKANTAQYGHDRTLGVLKFIATKKGLFKVHSTGITSAGVNPSNCVITVNGVTRASLRQDLVAVQVDAGDVVKIIPTSTSQNFVRIVGFVLEGVCGVSLFVNDAGYVTSSDLAKKADKVSTATNGNFASLDSNGNLKDSGHKHSDYLTQHQDLTNYVQKSQTAGLLKNDGTVDTNTYLTQHQDISGKEDITPIEAVASGTTAITAQVNKYYEVAGTVSSLMVTLPTPTVNTEVTMVVVHLTVGTSPTVVVTSSATVSYSAAYAVVANKEYELSCLYNGSKWIVSSMEVAV